MNKLRAAVTRNKRCGGGSVWIEVWEGVDISTERAKINVKDNKWNNGEIPFKHARDFKERHKQQKLKLEGKIFNVFKHTINAADLSIYISATWGKIK